MFVKSLAYRIDIGTLKPPVKLPGGRLRVDARLTRTGVFVYRNPDGTTRYEYRPPEEVFHEDSLATYEFAPVTDDHPPEMVTADNAKDFAVGSAGESVRRDGTFVAAPLVVNEAGLVDRMESKKQVEVSTGYEVELDETPGVTDDGQRYDAIQRNIRVNHIAIVKNGRAGPHARVRMDGVAQMISEPTNNRQDETAMEELKKELAEAIKVSAQHEARADKLETELQAEKLRADTAEAERDAEKVKIDKIESERKDAEDKLTDSIRTRVALETKATSLGVSEVTAEMSDREIKAAVIHRIDGADVDLSEKPDAYVDVRYDMAIESAAKGDKAHAAMGEIVNSRKDSKSKVKTAREAMLERNTQAWKNEASA